jgi:hypothetical protein
VPLLDQIREEKLINLAKTSFDPPPTEAEEKVLRDSASSLDPDMPTANSLRPTIRSDFVRWLATDPEAGTHIDPKGLRVYAATIPGNLDLRECHVNPTLDFRHCVFQGAIDLRSAETRGLFFLNSSLAGGMSADRAIVHGPLFLRPIVSEGAIRLPGARIEGNLDCEGAKLRAKGDALNADRAQVDGSVFLRGSFKSEKAVCFESEGAIRLVGAEIGGVLDCSGAKLKGKDVALSAAGARIGGGVFLNGGLDSEGMISFESEGPICLHGMEVGWNLMIRGAKVGVVDCQDAVVNGDLIWQRIENPNEVTLNLAGVRVKNLRDDQKSWLEEGKLDLDGLVYEELTLHDETSNEDIRAARLSNELPLGVKERIEWIRRQPKDRRTEPQPWMELRDLLERKGDRKGAKYVLFRFRCLQAERKEFHPLRWLFKVLSRLSTIRCVWPYFRYPNRLCAIAFAWLEEAPIRICWSIAFTLTVGWLIFAGAFNSGAMIASVQVQPNALLPRPSGESRNLSAHYPLSQSFLYTLENAVPLVKLGMDEKWMPDPKHKPQPWFPQFRWLDWLGWFNSYWFLVWSRVLLIFLGWFQAGVLGAALLRRFKE